MTVAILQVWHVTQIANYGSRDGRWVIVSVHATKELAEAEASLRGYTRWSVSEFGVMGVGK